jgi:hypothetical protein
MVDFVVCTLAVKKKIRAGFDMSDRIIPFSDGYTVWYYPPDDDDTVVKLKS